ncbi:MAG: hypothetical protein JWQ23_3972 [Herminiimonas sp.]|nr:hypothetical protein [Herminiimonas sp.]
MHTQIKKRWQGIALTIAAGAALPALLALAFMAYLQPSFIVDLANRFILCF